MARTAQYTEQVSLLVSEEMKAFLLGSAKAESVSEADVIRTLLDGAFEALSEGTFTQELIDARIELGRRELAERAERARQRAARNGD